MEWKRFGLRTRVGVDKFVRGPYQTVKDAIVRNFVLLPRTRLANNDTLIYPQTSGDCEKSFVSEILGSELGDDFMKMWIAGTICTRFDLLC